jgi:hypothetical protein
MQEQRRNPGMYASFIFIFQLFHVVVHSKLKPKLLALHSATS